MTVYGPYKRRDGRQIVIHYEEGRKHTQSYPRYIMEQYLGRKLEKWEHVDHVNNDPTDDRIENFQLLTQKENNQKAASPIEIYRFMCPECGSWTEKEARRVRHNRKQGKAGPYCSRRCAGMAK